MIKREVIDEILNRTDIESLISGYVSLKRAGSNVKGLCPFHNEKSPSFTVFPQNNSFYCFGCGVGGNAITFIRQIEHLDYPDAVIFLGKRAGITVVDEQPNGYTNEPKVNRDRMFAMNVDAAKFFHASLLANNPDAKAALSYFTDTRKLSMATISHFGLGYAPNSFNALLNHMRSKGYKDDELIAGNLVTRSEKGHVFDAFRNRVMFPIIDVSGNVIAFGGRVMDDSKPKYKNSSDTPIYKKLRNLFALNFARLTCEKTLILCEGYMDVIAMHAAGFTNAVATLGTAITQEQAKIMSRYTKRVVISYDADEAGQKAAQRAMKMLEEVGLEVSVLKVPGAKDPDEYIKKYGREKFEQVLEGSKSKFDYNMERILDKYDISLPQDKINALSALGDMISEFYSAAERDVYIRVVAQKLGVDLASFQSDVKRKVGLNLAKKQKEQQEKLKQNAIGLNDHVNMDFVRAPSVAKNEENVLGLLLLYEPHRKRVFSDKLLCEDDFYTDLGRRVFAYVKECFESGEEGELNETFSPEEVGRITKMKISRMQLTDNSDNALDEAIRGLKDSLARKKTEGAKTFADLNSLIEQMRAKTTNS